MIHPECSDEPPLSHHDLAVLLGVPVDELKACVTAQRDTDGAKVQTTRLPAMWLERGRSRTDVYRQATGRSDMVGALEFWRAQRDKKPDGPGRCSNTAGALATNPALPGADHP